MKLSFAAELAKAAELSSGSPMSSAVPSAGKAAPKMSTPSAAAPKAAPGLKQPGQQKPISPNPVPKPQVPAVQPNYDQYFKAKAPGLMQQVAPQIGAAGGLPALMATWDMIGGSHGENFKTIFGDRGAAQPAARNTMSQGATSAASGQALQGAVPAGPAPQAPPVPKATVAPPNMPIPNVGNPGPVNVATQLGQDAAATPKNWAQQYRGFVGRQTSPVSVAGVPINPGEMAHDMGGGIGTNLGINYGARKLVGAKPGFLPVNAAMDGLDMVGLDPFSDRFGSGAMGGDEARARARGLAEAPVALRSLQAGLKPLSTIYQGAASGDEALGAIGDAASGQDATMRMEAVRSRATGQAPSTSVDPTSEYFYGRDATGAPVKRTLGGVAGKIHEKAWEQSSVPGFNYLGAAGEAGTDAMMQLREQFKRKDLWREWAKNREAELQTTPSADPAELAKLQASRKAMASGTASNLYRNVTDRGIVAPWRKDFWRGNWHMPWSSDVD